MEIYRNFVHIPKFRSMPQNILLFFDTLYISKSIRKYPSKEKIYEINNFFVSYLQTY